MGISYIPPYPTGGGGGSSNNITATKGRFRATKGQTTFNISMDYTESDLLFIHHNNLYMEESDATIGQANYTVNGKVVTMFPMSEGDLVSWVLIKCGSVEQKVAICGLFKCGELKVGEGKTTNISDENISNKQIENIIENQIN